MLLFTYLVLNAVLCIPNCRIAVLCINCIKWGWAPQGMKGVDQGLFGSEPLPAHWARLQQSRGRWIMGAGRGLVQSVVPSTSKFQHFLLGVVTHLSVLRGAIPLIS